jgi:hypothetical protein
MGGGSLGELMQAESKDIDQAEAVVEAPLLTDAPRGAWQFSLRQMLLAVTILCPVVAALGGTFGVVVQAIAWCAAAAAATLIGLGAQFLTLIPVLRALDWLSSHMDDTLARVQGRPLQRIISGPTIIRPTGLPPTADGSDSLRAQPFQFSLRGLLGATTLIALMLAAATGAFGEAAQMLAALAGGVFLVMGFGAILLLGVWISMYLLTTTWSFMIAGACWACKATIGRTFARRRDQEEVPNGNG